MIRYNIKIALRNLLKSKHTSIINIVGITLGLTTSLLLLMYVTKELNTDSFFKNNDRIYRVEREGGGIWLNHPSIDIMKQYVPEIEKITSFSKTTTTHDILKYKNTNHVLHDVILADSSFFHVFSYQPLYGNLENCLMNPNSIVMCQSEAEQIFGKSNPVGKSVNLTSAGRNSGQYEMTVTAVIKDPPENTSINFKNILSQRFISNNKISHRHTWNWSSGNQICYILLSQNATTQNTENTIYQNIKRMIPLKDKEDLFKFRLNPLHGLYFQEVSYSCVVLKSGKKPMVVLLGIIGILILAVAGVNYFNLILAQIKKRLQNIGTNKVLGAIRLNIIAQMFFETTIIISASVAISLIIIKLILPFFNKLLNTSFGITDIFSPVNITIIAFIVAACIIIL